MTKKITLISLLTLFFVLTNNMTYAQSTGSMKPIVRKPVWSRVSPPLKTLIKLSKTHKTGIDSMREIENELDFHPKITKINQPDALSAIQRGYTPKGEVINVLKNFDGVYNIDGVAPPDTQGDVGNSYYIQTTNGHSIIKDKNGNTVQGPFKTSAFWAGSGYDDLNNGDAVVLWDEAAQRWVVTQFYLPDSGDKYLLIAVSTSSNPTGSYNQYAYPYSDMPDYPKWAVWPDGYYMGANAFSGNNYAGAYVTAFDRQAMINGDPTPNSVTFGPDASLWSIFPADADVFPTYGDPCPFVSDNVSSTSGNNEVYIYNFHVDWNNTNNSSFTSANTLTVNDYSLFGSDTQVPQSGTSDKLDLLQSRIMYRPYYRKFSDHESLLMCRTVNDGGLAAIRWYEFRKSGNNWSVYQQGTYNPGGGLWRWMPSIAMNANGDIALGYSVSSSSTYPSIRVVARYANDPLGVMTTDEKEVLTGTAAQTGVSRWGDYSMMSVDPTTDNFWFTTEYSSGGWDWKTRITHFELPTPCTGPTTQASNFSATAIGDNQMTVNWTRGNGDKVLVVAKEGAAVDATPSNGTNYTDNATFGNGDEIGYGNFVVYDGTGTSVTVTGLTAGTTYHYAVYEYFTADNCYNTAGLTGNETTTGTTPCTPCYSWGNTDYDTGTTRVIFNTINNASAKPTDGNGNAYSDYTNISTDVVIGNSYDLTVNVNTDGSNYTVASKVWIDWNQDCDFDDAGEEYDLGSAHGTDDGPTANSPLSITVPGTALTGNTTMRVSSKYNSAPTSCQSDFDGEVEDYTLNITSSSCVAPSITTQPAGGTICEGGNHSFSVTADGTATLSYQWKKDGSNISGATSASYTVSTATTGDAGSYTCYVSNACGNVTSNAATLTVNVATAITSHPQDVTANVGDNVSFDVVASGSSLAYQWRFNTVNIAGAESTTYSITDVQTTNAGSYDVVISGDCGNVTSNQATLDINSSVKNQGDNLIKIYPNPTNGIFTVELPVEKSSIKITDISGKVVYKTTPENKVIKIDLRNEAKGIYFIKVKISGKSVVNKLILK